MKMNDDLKYIHEDFMPFELDPIQNIIIATQKNKENIISGWNKVMDFVVNFPTLVHYDEYGKDIKGNLNKIMIKNEYILDSIDKIYLQVIKHPTFILKKIPTINIFFYSYEPENINRWINEKVPLGEIDNEGMLNNGSSVILRYFHLDWRIFLLSYKEHCN